MKFSIRDVLWLTYLGECLQRVGRYTAGGRAALSDGGPTRDALLRNLQDADLGEGFKPCP